MPFASGIREILKVRLGEYDVSTTAEPLPHQVSYNKASFIEYSNHFQEFNVSDIKIHPNFNNATLVNDIALLKLERPAKRQQVRVLKKSAQFLSFLFRILMWYA